jgi:hypothetical protein
MTDVSKTSIGVFFRSRTAQQESRRDTRKRNVLTRDNYRHLVRLSTVDCVVMSTDEKHGWNKTGTGTGDAGRLTCSSATCPPQIPRGKFQVFATVMLKLWPSTA